MNWRAAAPPGAAALILAHGSRDPRHARGVEGLATAVARRLNQPVAVAYLDHHGPTPQAAARSLSERGAAEVRILPLFTAAAYHVNVDVPAAVARIRAAGIAARLVTPGIAGSPQLLAGVVQAAGVLRLRAGAIVLGTGSSVSGATALLASQVARLSERAGVPLAAAFIGGGADLAQAAALLTGAGRGTPFVVPFVVSAGMFHDRMTAGAAALGLPVRGRPLTQTPAVARLVASRFAGEIGSPVPQRRGVLAPSFSM